MANPHVTDVIYDAESRVFQGRIRFSGTDLSPSLRVRAPGHPDWTYARIVDALIHEGARYAIRKGWI